MKPFADFLKKEGTILHCGGTGTELMKRGGDTPGGISVLTCPELVEEIHREYVAEGAEILLTSTFSMTEPYVKSHTEGYDWREINEKAVPLCKRAAENKAYVLGNLGPIGELMTPLGPLTEAAATAAFAAQAEILAAGGVDGFSVQTFYDLAEMRCAVKAVRSVSDLPIVCSLVIEPNGATFMGCTLTEAYEALLPLEIQCIGHNCGNIDFITLGDLLAPLAESFSIPLIACPNAGLPRTHNGIPIYDMTPTAFAEGCAYLQKQGVKIIGGCCGVNREHIKAARKILK